MDAFLTFKISEAPFNDAKEIAPGYLNATRRLYHDITCCKNIIEKRKVFQEFTRKYTTIFPIWQLWQ